MDELGFECSVGMLPAVIQMFYVQVSQHGRYPRSSKAARIITRLYRDGWLCDGWVERLVSPLDPISPTAATAATTT